MKRKFRALIGTILALALAVSALSVPAFAKKTDAVTEETEIVQGKVEYAEEVSIILENVEVLDDGGLVIITEQEVTPPLVVRVGSEISILSTSEKQKSKAFTYTYYDKNGDISAIAKVTVTGTYSEVENSAHMSSILVKFSGTNASSYSFSSTKSGATGNVKIYVGGVVLVGNYSYQIYKNGTISQI